MSSVWQVRRSGTDAKLGGVCAGLAAHWGVDPVLIRVAAVLLALTGGIGLVLYPAGWLLVPEQGRERSLLAETVGWASRVSRQVWLVLVGVACALVAVLFSPATPFGFGTALVVGLVWYIGSRRTRAARQIAPPPPAVAVSPRDAYAAFLAEPDPVGLYTEPGPAPDTPAPDTPSQPAPRPGSTPVARRLRRATLVGLVVVLAGLGIADVSGVPVPFAGYAATALLVVGLALVAATWLGRARGLLPLALLLALTTAVASTGIAATASDALRHPGDFGRRDLSYATAAALPAGTDRLDTGTLDVDLSALQARTGTTYRAHVDNGRLQVRIPADTGITLRYDVGLGEVDGLGQQYAGGTDLTGTVELVPPATGQPTVRLELSVDRGAVQVVR